MDVKNASGKARTHLTAVVTVHAEWSALAQRLVPVGEFAQTTCCENGGVRRLEVSVHNQSTVVDEAVVVDAFENIRVYVTMTTGDQYTGF